ncbi:MAG: protein-L-isoaspartate O-methyltransferase [Gammaproteobacteria bacterium]|nr:protein-L-isoaspartate O-methyltransferase [Gammaproteobacteria bacterium]
MTDFNTELARYNMIEQQVRPWDVLDPQTLEVMASTPRERFVPKELANLAFTDTEIPLEHEQTMLEPKLEGRILQLLTIKPTDRILEIGTGSGYLTACLAKIGGNVVSVDIYPEFGQHAQQQLAGLGLSNVKFEVGDASQGWKQDGEFDVIVVTGSLPMQQEALHQSLTTGGRMFAVIGNDLLMDAQLITRISANEWNIESLFETHLPPLLNAKKPQAFVF